MKTGIEELFYVGGFLGKEIEDKRKTILRVEEELLGKKEELVVMITRKASIDKGIRFLEDSMEKVEE